MVYGRAMNQKLIGYVRVSTDKQIESAAGIDAQISYIKLEAERRGLELEIVSEGEGASGKSMGRRSALNDAMNRLDKGEASALIVSKLDRLTRSVADFLTILERSKKGRWSLVIGDLAIDTSSPMGEAMATISATFAQLERRRIGERTREGLAQKRLQGVVLGRPVTMPASTFQKIVSLHEAGTSFNAIARQLNSEGIPTTHGGSNWYASTISKAINRIAA